MAICCVSQKCLAVLLLSLGNPESLEFRTKALALTLYQWGVRATSSVVSTVATLAAAATAATSPSQVATVAAHRNHLLRRNV